MNTPSKPLNGFLIIAFGVLLSLSFASCTANTAPQESTGQY